MIAYKGVKVKICVDGVDIPEYLVEEDLARAKVTCWIPSQIGREFAIVTINERQEKCAVTVKVDGKNADELMLNCFETRNATFFRPSSSVEQPFAFAKLDPIDDGILLNTSGEIELVCQSPVHAAEALKNPNDNKTFSETKALDESAGEHVGFGCAERMDHIATFVLRYQPLEYLRAWGIMPSTLQRWPTTSMAGATLDKGGPQPEATGCKRKKVSEDELITTGSKSTTELPESERRNHKRAKTCLKDGDPAAFMGSSTGASTHEGTPDKGDDGEPAKTVGRLNMKMDEDEVEPASDDNKHLNNATISWSLCTEDDKRPVFYITSDAYPKHWRKDDEELRARITETKEKWPNAILAAFTGGKKNQKKIDQILGGILDFTGVKVEPDDVETLGSTTPWIVANVKNEVAALKLVNTGLIYSREHGFMVTFRRMCIKPAAARNWIVRVPTNKDSKLPPDIMDVKTNLFQVWEKVEEIWIAPLGQSKKHFYVKTKFPEEMAESITADKSYCFDNHGKYEIDCAADCKTCHSHSHPTSDCPWTRTGGKWQWAINFGYDKDLVGLEYS